MFNKFLTLLLTFLLTGLLVNCASTTKFEIEQVDRSLTPQSVLAEPAVTKDKLALWGGTILSTRNLKVGTQLEVLAYPLNSSHKPLLDKKPLGRFIIKYDDYLEPATYAQGRLISVVGSVGESQSGKIGESSYTYPVINSQQLHLWSADGDSGRTNFHFGIGIGIHN